MIPLQLDPASEQRLQDLATASGRDAPDLVRQIVGDYLDAQAWELDAPEAWAEASVALTPEILPDESWDDGAEDYGSR